MKQDIPGLSRIMTKMVKLIVWATLLCAATASAQRLPDNVVPVNYRLTFTPDMEAKTFHGEAVIDVQLRKPATEIVLNAVELKIETASIESGRKSQKAKVETGGNKGTIRLALPAKAAAGPAVIRMQFSGPLGSQLRGFYLGTANGHSYAASDFEPSDARRMFPSFDEPAMKATFEITAIAPKGMVAISNSPVVSDTEGPGTGQHTVKFARTAKISTYLMALIVGNFACTEGKAEGIPVRVCSTPDKQPLSAFALEAAERSLQYFNGYFAMKYPFPKLDLIALPDFAAGAMENVGAITFRESLLLVDAGKASENTKKTAANVIAHEIAHQWFGDLVTLNWWDDVWLNEGFATWMETKPLAGWKPEWNIALDEAQELGSSVNYDSRSATRAIHVGANEAQTPEQVENLFDGIAYGKAATILRMVESYVGPESFRDGVNEYIKEHAFGSARSEDFWNTISRVTGRPVSKIFSTFVEQPGVPLVSVQAKCEDDKTRIELEQRRFFGSRRMREQESKELWEIPVCFRTSEVAAGGCRMVTEHKQEIVLPGCHPWIFANGGARGYYVSEYDAAAASGIVANTGSLSEAERLVLLNNTWALVAAGEREADGYLDLTESLQSDDHAEIWRDIGEKLGWLRDRVLQGDAVQKNYEEWVRKLLLPTAERLGWSERPGDTEQVRQLRAAVLSILGNVGQDNAALKQAAELAKKYLDNPASVDPALAGTVLNLTARQGDSALYEQILARVKEPRRPDEHYRLLAALGNFRDPQLLGRTLELTLTDTVRGQDVMRAISGVLYNPAGRELAWDFLRSRWPQLQKKVPESNLTYFAEMGTAFCDADHRQQFKDFFTETRMPGVQRKVRQSLESIDGCVEMRRSQLPQVQTWLRRHEAAAAGGGAH